MIDFSKLQKGRKVKLKDGRVLVISGLYLSATGPSLMCKHDASQTTAQNVPIEDVQEILEG